MIESGIRVTLERNDLDAGFIRALPWSVLLPEVMSYRSDFVSVVSAAGNFPETETELLCKPNFARWARTRLCLQLQKSSDGLFGVAVLFGRDQKTKHGLSSQRRISAPARFEEGCSQMPGLSGSCQFPTLLGRRHRSRGEFI